MEKETQKVLSLKRYLLFEEVLYFLPNALPKSLLNLWVVKAVD